MPNTKSAKKAARVATKKAGYNRPIRSALKTYITKAENLILDQELEAAEETVKQAVSALDKAAQKGVVHRNNAARRKSRLLKKLNTAKASPAN